MVTEGSGCSLGRGLVKPHDAKLKAIQDWPCPVSKTQVKSFVGLATYYRRIVPNFSDLIAPLTDLTTKRQTRMVKWTQKAVETFTSLKKALCSHPVLAVPDFNKKFVVQAGASEVGLGAVLSQVKKGEEHPILYCSRKLLPHEKRYSTLEKECLAIKWALETHTAHRPCTSAMDVKK